MKRLQRPAIWTVSILACTFTSGCQLADAAADGVSAGITDLVTRIVISIVTGQPLA